MQGPTRSVYASSQLWRDADAGSGILTPLSLGAARAPQQGAATGC